MSTIEARYRRLLRLLPATYRAAWEDDMVAAFLDSVATDDPDEAEFIADQGRPGWREVASITALAVRLRLSGPGGQARAVAWGDAVRHVALVGLLVSALLLPMGVAQMAWINAGMPLPTLAREALAVDPPAELWRSGWTAVGALWLLSFVALVVNRWRWAKVLTVLAFLPVAGAAVWTTVTAARLSPLSEPVTVTLWVHVLVTALPAVALAAFHHEAPPVDTSTWLSRLAVGVLVVPVPAIALLYQSPERLLLDWPGVLCLAWAVAAAAHLTAGRRRRPAPSPGVSLGVVLLAVPVLALRVAALIDFATLSGSNDTATVAIGGTEALAVTVLAAWLAVRTVRRLPPLADPPNSSVISTGGPHAVA